jgi:hypothetical protein
MLTCIAASQVTVLLISGGGTVIQKNVFMFKEVRLLGHDTV